MLTHCGQLNNIVGNMAVPNESYYQISLKTDLICILNIIEIISNFEIMGLVHIEFETFGHTAEREI